MKRNKKSVPAGLQRKKLSRRIWQCRELYLLLLYPVVATFIFHYIPIYGVLLAFKENDISRGLLGGDWVGLANFRRFFGAYNWKELIWNTFRISSKSLIVSFPFPILLAIFLNEIRAERFKKTVQLFTYMPHFISTVVVVGMISLMLDDRSGILAKSLHLFGMQTVNIMGDKKAFDWVYIFSGVWQGTGFSSIIYLAALSNVDAEIQEAALIDGASRLKRIWYIDLPSIMPTISILLILNLSGLLSVGYEKIYLMQNPMNLQVTEVISTYVYKQGLQGADFAYSTAVGLMNGLVSLVLLVVFNSLARATKQASWF